MAGLKAVRGLGASRAARRSDADAERRRFKRSMGWYKTARWIKLRAAQLAQHPLCAICAKAGRDRIANVCDHIEPHREDEAKFWAGPFQSLCAPCHASIKQREERGQVRG